MARGLTGGLAWHCPHFLESLLHASLKISEMIEALFLAAVPAVPILLGLVPAAAESPVEEVWKQTGNGDDVSLWDAVHKALGIETTSFLNWRND